MAHRVRVREISAEEGDRLLRIVRRDSGSVVTWRRAHVLLSAQGRMIRRYLAWRNRHADDQKLREIVNRAKVA